MKAFLVLYLVALLLAGATSWHAREPEPQHLTCLSVQQHVNSVYERAYRGETELTRDAVRELHWLERSLCAQEVTPAP